jgi:hypothetical protein
VALRRRPISPQIGRRAARLRLAPAPVQNPFGIAIRLRPSLEDQVVVWTGVGPKAPGVRATAPAPPF